MNANIDLTEELLFKKLSELKRRRVNVLKYSGIITINDFLYSDLDSLSCSKSIKLQLKGLQRLLRYKYLDEFVSDFDKFDDIYYPEHDGISIDNMLEKLGFIVFNSLSLIANSAVEQSGTTGIKTIDIIRELSTECKEDYFRELAKLYIECYKDYQIKKARDIDAEKVRILKMKLEAINYKLKVLNHEKEKTIKQIESIEAKEDKTIPNNYNK